MAHVRRSHFQDGSTAKSIPSEDSLAMLAFNES